VSSEQLVVDCNATEWLGGNSVILPMNSLRSKNRNGINLFASQQPSGELPYAPSRMVQDQCLARGGNPKECRS